MTTTRDPDPGPRPGTTPRSKQRLAVIGALQSCKGEVTNESGRATAVLMHAMKTQPTPKALAALLSAMERDNDIARKVRGKRTFSIRLVGYDGSVEHVEHLETPIPYPIPDEPVVVVEPVAGPPPTTGTDYDRLAHALLAQVGSILANGQGVGKDELLRRVHDLTQANLKLARRLEVAEDLVHAKDTELRGLRTRLAATEANLTTVLKQSGTNGLPMDGKSQRAIERFMQQRPHERTS